MDVWIFFLIYTVCAGLLLSIAYYGYKHPIEPKENNERN
jgi:hypothetical protein